VKNTPNGGSESEKVHGDGKGNDTAGGDREEEL
jgi:hypothetical protein